MRREDPEFFERRSSLGGQACLQRYGADFYRHIRQIGLQRQEERRRKGQPLKRPYRWKSRKVIQ